MATTRWCPLFQTLFLTVLALGSSNLRANEDAGVKANEVLVGMSTALSGATKNLGEEMRRGVEAYFSEVNSAGGIHGRKLTLVALDDGYEPGKAGPNMRSLIEEKKVFAILGNVGTPTAVVAVPIANEKKVPFFGAFTGAGILRKTPPDRYVFNFRASYVEETATMVKGLVNELKIAPEQIALFTQNDAYGDAGYTGAVKALQEVGYKDIAKIVHGRYARNTANIEDGLSRILDAPRQPKAVIMVGAYKACAKFIKLAKQEGLNALFLNVSFVGSEALLEALGPKDSEGVIVTQVVPPFDSGLAVLGNYNKALGRATPTFISLEGYLAAKSFAETLRRAGKDPSREGFVDAFEAAKDFDVGLGLTHKLGKDEHQISHNVWPTIIRGGKFSSLRWQDISLPQARDAAKQTTK